MKKTLCIIISLCFLLTLFPVVIAEESRSSYLLYEDFEQEPLSWRNFDMDGDEFAWTWFQDEAGYEPDAYEGKGYISSASYYNTDNIGALHPDNWMTSPAFTCVDGAVLSWYVKAQDKNYPNDIYAVYVLPADFDGYFDDAVQIYRGTAGGVTKASSPWKNITCDLSAYAGYNICLGFRHYDCTDEFWIDIDLITVTAETATPLPYGYKLYEDFETQPANWTFIDADGDGYSWDWVYPNNYTSFKRYSGQKVIGSASYINDVGTLTPDNWLISPSFTASKISMLTWHAVGQDDNYVNEKYMVYVLPADYSELSEARELYSGEATADWVTIQRSLAAYDGQEIRIAFRHKDTDKYWLLLDLVTVEEKEEVDLSMYGLYENFENYPVKWKFEDKDGDGLSWDWNTAYTWGYAGEGKGYIISMSYLNGYGELNPDNWMISPPFTAADDCTLTWLATAHDPLFADEQYAVYVLNADYTSYTSGTQVFSGKVTTNWAKRSVDLSAYGGQDIRIAFRHFNSSSGNDFALAIDLVTATGKPIDEIPQIPTDIPEGYLLYEDFEDKPTDWTYIDMDGDGRGWDWDAVVYGMNNPQAYEGKYYIISASYLNNIGALHPDNWMISHPFRANSGAKLTWHVKAQDNLMTQEYYAVYVLPANYDTLSQAKEIYTGKTTADWKEKTIDLSEYAGQDIVIAFRHYNSTDNYMIALDMISVSDGEYVQPTPTPTQAPTPTPTPTGEPTSEPTSEPTEDPTGEPTPTSELQQAKGDANGDGKINTADATLVLKDSAGMINLEGDKRISADCNSDGKVNTADAVLILKYAAGMITSFAQ